MLSFSELYGEKITYELAFMTFQVDLRMLKQTGNMSNSHCEGTESKSSYLTWLLL